MTILKTRSIVFATLMLITFYNFCSIAIGQRIELEKIEDYTKGELIIMVAPFGLNGNEISVGKVLEDGTIIFNWPEIDISTIKSSEYFMSSIKNTVEMNFCNEKEIEVSDDGVKAVDTKTLFLYKYGQQVGSLYPATQREIEDNGGLNRSSSLILGSTISWFYSNGAGNFKAKCKVINESKGNYNFNEITTYDIQLKKGWNIVQHTLLEKEDWKNDSNKGSLPKAMNKKTVDDVPTNVKWYLKYWANDELLELQHQLSIQSPINKEQYKAWIPKKIKKLKRTGFEIGKQLERIPTTNNVNIVFERKSKKIDVTIVDCASSKESASVYTLMMDMTSTEWKDENEKGYNSATKIENIPVLIEYKKIEKETVLSYNTNNRFIVKAIAINMKPEEIWDYLKLLNIGALIEK